MKFYDTCAALELGDKIFVEPFALSSITLQELENIKTSANKDNDIKMRARKLLHLLDEQEDKWTCILHCKSHELHIHSDFEITNDMKILSDACAYAANTKDYIKFVTFDLALRQIASVVALKFDNLLIDTCYQYTEDDYTGYQEIECTSEELANFYEHQDENIFNLRENEYLILRHDGEVVDLRVWRSGQHQFLDTEGFYSKWFGKVIPYKGDIYQKMLFDSLRKNRITLVQGPAGSGKTITSLAFLVAMLEKHQIDKIIVFCNTVATYGSAKLGFYPGTRDEKLLDSQIGNLLASKLGGRAGVEQLIASEKLVLLPLSDLRGYDTNGMQAGIYISEAQNLDVSLMKLAVQRIGEDCICIIDGDRHTQVDDLRYAGNNSGMKRLSEVFRGEEYYGEVTLRNIYRSRIAARAEQM